MDLDLIIECERCKEKTFTSIKDVNKSATITYLITKYSKYENVNVFNRFMILCPNCQKEHDDYKEKRIQKTQNFINNTG